MKTVLSVYTLLINTIYLSYMYSTHVAEGSVFRKHTVCTGRHTKRISGLFSGRTTRRGLV